MPNYTTSLTHLVDKATDATLLQDNWQYILDVCDKVTEDPEEGSRVVIKLIGDKLHQRDANVQLRTLSLLTSIAENCGSRVKQEIASKSFTSILLSKLDDSHVHKDIKVKIVQVITQLSESFKSDPSLKPIQSAFKDVKSKYSQYFPPEKPQKHHMSADRHRLKEEEDLKAAIALSLQESQSPSQSYQPASYSQGSHQQQQQQASSVSVQQAPVVAPHQQQQTLNFSRVRALYDSFSEDPADLKFRKGDVITVIERVYKDWGKGSLRGTIGLFPFNYVTPLYDPTPAEIAKEIETENEILQKSRQVEKLLALLTSVSNSDEAFRLTNGDEFRTLYQDIALIKPELATLIDKYRQRKDDLLDLHQKLKEASVIYEDLTDPLKYQYQQQHRQSYYPLSPQQQQQSVQPQLQQSQYKQPTYSTQSSQQPQQHDFGSQSPAQQQIPQHQQHQSPQVPLQNQHNPYAKPSLQAQQQTQVQLQPQYTSAQSPQTQYQAPSHPPTQQQHQQQQQQQQQQAPYPTYQRTGQGYPQVPQTTLSGVPPIPQTSTLLPQQTPNQYPSY